VFRAAGGGVVDHDETQHQDFSSDVNNKVRFARIKIFIEVHPDSTPLAEQALLLLQEQILTAWRGRRILSLISFDVKGAYNGVCKERLL
jgi:hypothetical protein